LTIALSRRQLRIWGEITCGSCPHLKIVASLEICSKSANSSALTVANKTNTAFFRLPDQDQDEREVRPRALPPYSATEQKPFFS
jgi:hypothetical protein